MSRGEANISARMWDAVGPEARRDWVAAEAWRTYHAASDHHIQSTLRILGEHDYRS